MHATTDDSPKTPKARMDLILNHRILVVDDNEAIQSDYRKILGVDEVRLDFEAEEQAIFGNAAGGRMRGGFDLVFASQGQEAVEIARKSLDVGERFAVVFMDMRMPPGWDGLETTNKLWEVDPDLQVVICTAYSDYSWEEMMDVVESPERLLILKKPFDAIEVLQFAHALTEKWSLLQAVRANTESLEGKIRDRTAELLEINTKLSQEIKERTRTETELRKSETALALSQHVAQLGSWEIDLLDPETLEGNPLRWSRETFRIFGFPPGKTEVNNETFFTAVHPADRERIVASVAELLKSGMRYSTDHRIITPSGEERIVHEEAKLILDDITGRPLKIAGTVQDVTVRKVAQEKISEQARMLDLAHDAIMVRDLDQRITFWNRGAERLYGWSSSEAMGKSVYELLYREDATFFQNAVETVMAAGEWSGESHKASKSNLSLTVYSRWTLMRDEQGNAKAILAINTDITEMKKLQAHSLRAQRLESIGTLAGGIAHDLNNALAPIMMGVELLRMEYPKESKIVEMFESSARRGADMVRQLLSFAKGAEGERASVHTDRLVKEMQNMINGSFPKNIDLVVKCDAKLPTILGDVTQLHQVLLNLCVNARDAMPGGGTLTLEVHRVSVDAAHASTILDGKVGDFVLLRVTDTGEGIPAGILEQIFDPFFTTKSADKGTGLGLSTVLGIVKGHGGFLEVHSQVRIGSTFDAYFPAEANNQRVELATKSEVDFRGAGETILLVDDEPSVREMARAVLRRLNFTPLTAIDGVDGLMQAAQNRTKLSAIVTDMHMPRMDGLTFVRALRHMLPEVPVLLASGMPDEHTTDEFKTLGVVHRLDKPFTEKELSEALRKVLKRE
ncbi:MAG: Histidine kinase [Verrucomicrobiales bacterium]|nr:Histidine kinase [Verrucomicrobiales bacterium]